MKAVRVAVGLIASAILACGPSPSLLPLERLAEGVAPDTLDWWIPSGASPLPLLDRLEIGHLDRTGRALLQRDLWMTFDIGHSGESRAPVRERIVGLLRRLALPAEEIARLPDTYAESTKIHPEAFDPSKRGQPYLPPDLFDPKGPWVVLRSEGTVALRHNSFFQHRSAFVILVRHPEGRDAAVRYVEGMARNKFPSLPDGIVFANVRRLLLISDQGMPVPSPITESVQIRHYSGPLGSEQAMFKFELDRKAMTLRAVGRDEAKPSYAVSFEHMTGKQSNSIPVLSTCTNCHFTAGPYGVQVFVHNSSLDYHLRPGDADGEIAAVVRLKTISDSWKLLKEHWDR